MLVLKNTGTTDASVQLTGGTEQQVLVPAGASVSVPVRSGSSWRLTPSSPVRAAVTMNDEDGANVAGWPLTPSAVNQQPIDVRP